jgi:hypothetical protein
MTNLGHWLGLELHRPHPNWDQLATSTAKLIPEASVWPLFQRAVSGVDISLCMHRVSTTHTNRMTIDEHQLDHFVEQALAHNSTREPWLTLSFDDGYADAADYIESRAHRFPTVEFLFFVCPEKVETRAGFRWDLPGPEDDTDRDVEHENERRELRALDLDPTHRLATVEQCRRIIALPNAALGNHTNCHFRPAGLPFEDSVKELRRSHDTFVRLFGEPCHFAFPFGKPNEDFDDRHIDVLHECGDFNIWTTARRPFHAEDREPGAVLPRFPVDGAWSATQLAFWVALLSARWRNRGINPHLLRPLRNSLLPPAWGGKRRSIRP